jgi:glycosyltransferase involved in cell wall biosynthesis
MNTTQITSPPAAGLRVALVGPLPPPPGGMANQTRQLARLLAQEGVHVEVVQTNAPYRPDWVGSLRGVRALFRLIPFLVGLWRAAGRVQLFHVMANSGWAWYLYASPAVWVAKLRGIRVLVNYRGGDAAEFFNRSFFWVRPTMAMTDQRVVPSGYLQHVFQRFGVPTEIVPNIIDLARFTPRPAAPGPRGESPHLVVTRNLEPLYDTATALRAFAIVREKRPTARLTVAGGGPERDMLVALAHELGVAAAVTFPGRLDPEGVAALYRDADVCLNASLHDNMPNSILEALASGVPVVSTDVCGIPFLVEHGKTALLVPPRDPIAMAQAVLDVLDTPGLAEQLAGAGRDLVQRYSWSHVRPRLLEVYRALTRGPAATAPAGHR